MNYTLHLTICGLLLCITVGLYLYRHWLENHGDHYIHLREHSQDAVVINAQAVMCKRCETVDKFKYGTLAATILYAVAIGLMAAYEAWNRRLL